MTGAHKLDEAAPRDPPGIVRVDRPVRRLFRGHDCACPSDSALHCAWLRYGDDSERCMCRCHELDDEE